MIDVFDPRRTSADTAALVRPSQQARQSPETSISLVSDLTVGDGTAVSMSGVGVIVTGARAGAEDGAAAARSSAS